MLETRQSTKSALEADARDLRVDDIAVQALATDWATLGALILEAAAIATARHLVQDARGLALDGSVVEPPATGTEPRA